MYKKPVFNSVFTCFILGKYFCLQIHLCNQCDILQVCGGGDLYRGGTITNGVSCHQDGRDINRSQSTMKKSHQHNYWRV